MSCSSCPQGFGPAVRQVCASWHLLAVLPSNQLKWRQFVLKALFVVILLLVIGGGLFVASMVSAPPVATVEKAIPHEVLVQ